MEIVAVALLVVILLVLILLFFKKQQAPIGLLSAEDFEKLKQENETLKITIAKADERVSNL